MINYSAAFRFKMTYICERIINFFNCFLILNIDLKTFFRQNFRQNLTGFVTNFAAQKPKFYQILILLFWQRWIFKLSAEANHEDFLFV